MESKRKKRRSDELVVEDGELVDFEFNASFSTSKREDDRRRRSSSSSGHSKPSLPRNWEQHFSKKHKRNYYYNSITHDTVWHLHEVKALEKNHLEKRPSSSHSYHSADDCDRSQYISPLKQAEVDRENIKRSKFQSSFINRNSTSVVQQTELDKVRDEAIETFSGFKTFVPRQHSSDVNNVSMESASPLCGNSNVRSNDVEEPMDIDLDVGTVADVRAHLPAPTVSQHKVSFEEDEGWPHDFDSWDEVLASCKSVGVFLVLDTNVLLSDLDFVRSLKKIHFKHLTLICVVPYIVLQELDALKMRAKRDPKYDKRMEIKIVNAINFIHKEIFSKPSFVLYQPASLDLEDCRHVRVEINDDRLLKCYIQLNERLKYLGHSAMAMLCTNDTNLVTKACAHDIVAMKRTHIQDLLREMSRNPSKLGLLDDNEIRSLSSEVMEEPHQSVEAVIDLNTCEGLFETGRQVLAKIVEHEFKQVYKNDAFSLYIIKPPWPTLKVVTEVIIKHWVAVFRYVWSEKESLDRFHAMFKILAAKKEISFKENCETLKFLFKLLEPFTQRMSCPNLVSVKRLLVAIKTFLEKHEFHLTDETIQKTVPKPHRKSDFNSIARPLVAKQRATVESVCGTIWSFIDETKAARCQALLESLHSTDVQHAKAVNDIQRLCECINNLVNFMNNVFVLVPDGSDPFRAAARAFCDCLNNFMQVAANVNKPVHFVPLDVDVFEAFMLVESNRNIFVEAGIHLQALINEMTNTLVSFV